MTRVYKSFKIFLNVNTIIDSPTMMSRRVYELLACGTPVVSAPSKAIDEAFPGIVQIARTKSQAIDSVARLLHDEAFRSRIAHLGYREVMRKHTYRKRLSVMLPTIGIPYLDAAPLVTVVLCTMRPHMMDRIVKNLTRQNCDRIEAIIVTQKFSDEQRARLAKAIRARPSNIERLEVIADDSERSLGDRLNHAVTLARGDFIAKMDDDDLYFENYLADMLIPFSFGNFGLVGKKELFMYLEGSGKLIRRYAGMQHRITDFVAGATFVARREIFQSIPFSSINQGEDSSFIKHVKAAGLSIYAGDPYNFVTWRHANVEDHTWRARDREFLESALTVVEGNEADFQRVCVV